MDNLRDVISAAYDEHSEPPAGEVGGGAPAAEPAAPAAAAGADAAPPSQEPTKEAKKPDGAPVRDEKGKFAKAEAAQQAPAEAAQPSEPPKAEETEPPQQEEMIRVPPGLPAPLKAKFKDLPPEWRDAFVRQEDSFKVAKTDWEPKAQRLNRFDEVLAPHRQRLALNGVDDITWVRNLAAAEQALIENPVAGIAHLARTYGADLRQVMAQMTGGQPGAPQGGAPMLDPNLQPLLAEIQTLKQAVTQQQQSAEETRRASATAQIEAFRNDPAHPYFEDVKDDIAALLAGGRATSLQDAYDKAVWANPEIRTLLQQEEAAKAAKAQAQAQERAKAAAAAQAAGSVTGAPGPGGPGPLGVDPTDRRALIAAAYDAAAGRV